MPHPKYDVLGKVPSDLVRKVCFCVALFGLPQPVIVWGMDEYGRQGNICLILG